MKNTIILILSLLVIGLGGYVIYDKVISKSSDKESTTSISQETNTDCVANNQNNNRDLLDLDYRYYYQNYLPVLVNVLHMYNYSEGTSFKLDNYASDDNIKWFLYKYYENSYPDQYDANKEDGSYSKTVTKSELDKLTYIVFAKNGLSDYSFTFREKFGIIKLDENTYKIVWYGTAGGSVSLKMANGWNTDNDILTVTSVVYSDYMGNYEEFGILKFEFKYNLEKQTYYLANIKEVK